MIGEGDTAPDFTLPGTAPGSERPEVDRYRLADHAREGPVVLAFYLFDFHPECTRQVCAIRDLGWFDLDPDTTVFGVSTDRAYSHHAFAREYDLDFTLLSDSDGAVSEEYGVLYGEFKDHKRVAKRSVFVVDPGLSVRYAWSAGNPTDHPDWGAVKEAVDGIETTTPLD